MTPEEQDSVTRGAHRRSILSATALIVVATLFAKGLGLLRDLVIAALYGASDASDAFFLALTIPAILSSALGSALGIAVVPVASEVEARGAEESRRFYGVFLQVSCLLAAGVSLALLLAAPLILSLTAGGLDARRSELALSSLRLLSFAGGAQIIYYALSGVLQSKKRFVPPPLCENAGTIALIGALVLIHSIDPGHALPVSWTLGSGVMAAALVAFFIAAVGYRPSLRLSSPWLGKLLKLALPMLLAGILGALPLALDRFFAASLDEGSIAALSFAFVLVNAPMYLLVLPASTAALPYLSDIALADDREETWKITGKTLKMLVAATVPVSLFCATHAEQLVQLVYQRGMFDASAAGLTASAIRGFSVGIVPMAVMLFLSRVLISYQKVGGVNVCLGAGVCGKMALSLPLMSAFSAGGLALATSGGFLISCILMTIVLYRRLGQPKVRPEWRPAIVSLAAAGASLAALEGLDQLEIRLPFVVQGILYLAIYSGLYFGLGPRERQEWREAIRSLMKRGS